MPFLIERKQHLEKKKIRKKEAKLKKKSPDSQ